MPYTYNAIRGYQQGIEYFITNLPLGAIDTLVVNPEGFDEMYDDDKKRMQRELNKTRIEKRSGEPGDMVNYLLAAEGAFFSALTLFMVPRDAVRYENDNKAKNVSDFYNFVPTTEDGNLGVLSINESVRLYPADGMHRSEAIKAAIRQKTELDTEEIPAILLKYETRDRVRQLFSDLNLNAKQPSKTLGYNFETRDPWIMIAKEMENLVPLFENGINKRNNSLSSTSANVITLNTLVTASVNDLYPALFGKTYRKDNPNIGHPSMSMDFKKATEKVADVWNQIIDCPKLKQEYYGVGKTPGLIREHFVFAHGIGWQALIKVASKLIEDYPDNWVEQLRDRVGKVQWERKAKDPCYDGRYWEGLAMTGDRINNTSSGIRETAEFIMNSGVRSDAQRQQLEKTLEERSTNQ